MKVLFKNMINGYTGVQDDYVMYYSRRYNKVIMRQRPKYKKMDTQNTFKVAVVNMNLLHPSQAYRDDLKAYCTAYNLARHSYDNAVTWNNIWYKLMWMMARINHGIDLKTITREQIYEQNLPCISVKRAVEEGLLPPVHGWTELVAEL